MLTRTDARDILQSARVPLDSDFHRLSSTQVDTC